jgi:photosystem II stability/assembly factor-like uncharacterized protein
MKQFALLFCACFVLFLSCKKRESSIEIPHTLVNLPSVNPVFKVIQVNDTTLIACGGIRDEIGEVFLSKDEGSTWVKTILPDNKCAYDVIAINDSDLIIGADFNFIYTSSNLGESWETQWHDADEIAYHELNRPNIKRLQALNEQTIFFVGGEQYIHGTIYKSTNGGDLWTFDTLAAELKGIHFLDTQHGIVSGFGYVAFTENGGETFQTVTIAKGFYVSAFMFSETEWAICENNGSILKTYDSGNSWQIKKEGNSNFKNRVLLNDMFFVGNIGYACGAYGVLFYSNDKGETWQEVNIKEQDHLFRISSYRSTFHISAQNGRFITLH